MINSTEIQDRVRNYIQTAPEVNLTDMMTSLRNDGVSITRPVALKALRAEGLVPYSTTLRGVRVRLWRSAESVEQEAETQEDETQEADEPQSKVESNIARLQNETEKLSSERANLFDLVQKSVDLKKQIRAQQATLLREMASLINELYGDSDEQ